MNDEDRDQTPKNQSRPEANPEPEIGLIDELLRLLQDTVRLDGVDHFEPASEFFGHAVESLNIDSSGQVNIGINFTACYGDLEDFLSSFESETECRDVAGQIRESTLKSRIHELINQIQELRVENGSVGTLEINFGKSAIRNILTFLESVNLDE